MLRRIPISLRFDDEESNFYYGFIEQKKNDRELSTLILDLLHAYYEDDIIKERLQFYLDGKSPFIHIHNELERIASEHSRHTVMTKMMGDYTANERKKTIEDEPPMEEVRKEETSSTESPKLLSESENYEALKKELKEEVKEEFKEEFKQDFLRELISQMGLGNLPTNNVVSEKTETVVDTTVKVEAPKVEVKEVPKVEDAPKIEITTEIDIEEKVEKPTVSVSNPVGEAPIVSPPQVSVGAEEQVKKPASFGKLLKSVK